MTYCADKLCQATFNEYSRSAVKIVKDKYNNKITRLLVTGTFNQKIGWANFDSSIHHVGNEDSEHFLAVYQRDNQIGPWFILSIQVVNRAF